MSSTTVLPFGGGELSSFDPRSGCIETTNASTFDAAVSRCSIYAGTHAAGGFTSPVWAAAADFWFHDVIWCAPGTDVGGENMIDFYSGATVVLRAIAERTSGFANTWTFYTLQSAVLTSVGSFNAANNVLGYFDVRVKAGASGSLQVYLGGTRLINSGVLDHSGFTGVTQIFGGGSDWGTVGHSQIICDNQSHVGDTLVTLAETTASAVNTGWTGAVGNINETVLNDTTSVTSDAAGQVSTYYKSGATLGTYNVVAICIGVRAQLTSGSSTNLQVALRTNATNYFSASIALDFGFQACAASWTTNPFTAAVWDPATAAIIEAGMKSIA